MVAITLDHVMNQVAQLPISDRLILKQWLNEPATAAHTVSAPNLSLTGTAERLNVSTSFVKGLIDRGELRATITADEPTFQLADVLEYKKRSDDEAAALLDELTAQAQELKMGYE